jgi:GGDEF domain-containing protein
MSTRRSGTSSCSPQIRYDADHDRLTGLPNRQRLAAEIEQLLSAEGPRRARA